MEENNNPAEGEGQSGEEQVGQSSAAGESLEWQGLAGQEQVATARRGRRVAAVAGALVVVAGVALAGVEIGRATNSGSPTAATQSIPSPGSSSGPSNGSSGSKLNVSAIKNKVDPAVVDITAVDGYQGSTDAGTGMVLTSNGEVLTNNHVVQGATKITARVDGTGTTYTAKVVGTDATDDVALLQLQNASGMKTVSVGNSSNLQVGQPVVAIGNALDLPGPPTVTSGAITALNRSITASDSGSSASENLSNMIQIDAPLAPGNSGGPLVNSSGQVIGMNTAAQSSGGNFTYGGGGNSFSNVGFSIPVNRALSIASQIQQGHASSTIQLGTPAFLGVDAEDVGAVEQGPGGFGQSVVPPSVSSGAVIVQVIPGSGAAAAGLSAGDVITAVDGNQVASVAALRSAIESHRAGQTVQLSWVDSSGTSHTAGVTLSSGPAA